MATARSDQITKGLEGPAPDIGALEAFVAVHYGRLLGLAGLVCGDATQAEDIVQSALERAWRSRAAIRDDGRLRPWLDRIVVREAAREKRTRFAWLSRLVRPPTVTALDAPERDLVDRAASRFPELRRGLDRRRRHVCRGTPAQVMRAHGRTGGHARHPRST